MKKLNGILNAFAFILVFTVITKAENPRAGASPLKEGDYIPNTIIIKMKSTARPLCGINSIEEPNISQAFAKLNVNAVQKMFPREAVPANERNSMEKKYVDLSLIYKIRYAGNVKIEKAIRLVQSTGMVEYAEPDYVQRMFFTPNDPQIGSQYWIGKINAYSAWNVWQGDTNTVIGIVDSGTDWDHPDLVNNIKYNYADPVNGLDDDGDGFTDNFRGWDVSENDNSPMVVGSDHGSHVSGCAAASTDNGTGVAAPAFKCKFLPVKCSLDASTTAINDGYPGIDYAMNHGCSIINCSWGRGGSYSQFEQDVINDAVFNHDIVVVAAAGNDGLEEDFWPASYDHVVSVAATNSNDSKAGFSNYGFKISVCAPGNGIFSTVYNNTYTNMSGTSMASPIVAGCLAMIRSRFPSLSALQAAEQLRVTCDNIYSLPQNANFINKLGSGRVNLYAAITDTTSPGVRVSNLTVTDRNDNVFAINDTLAIAALFTNLLRPTSNLTVTLTSSSSYLQVLSGSFNIGVLNTLDTISNYTTPFLAHVDPSAPVNTQVNLTMTLTDGAYQDFYSFHVIVNADYINININDVSTSITSIGRIGYNTSGPGVGLGFTYNGSGSLLYEAGLMTGTDQSHVSDNLRALGTTPDNDYRSVLTVARVLPGVSDFDAYGKFDDFIAPVPGRLDVLIQHRAYAWASAADRNYVMVQYNIKNIGTGTLSNFYAGIFADWDVLPDYNHNRSATDLVGKMGYSFSTDSGGYYTGVKLLSAGSFNHYAIDNDAAGQGGVNMSDGYSTSEKYTTLSTNRSNAGVPGLGNDVCDVTSSGPFTIPAGDSIVVGFAILAANDLATLQAGAAAAQIKYDTALGMEELLMDHGFHVNQNFPNPVSNQTTIRFTLPESNFTRLDLFNALGEKVKTIFGEKLNAGEYSAIVDLSSVENGVYFCRLTSGKYFKALPVVVAH